MAISHVGSTSAAYTTTTTSHAVDKPAGATTDDLVIVQFTTNGQTHAGPTGFTLLRNYVLSNPRTSVWYRRLTADDTSVTSWTWTTGALVASAIGASAYRGVHATAPFTANPVSEATTHDTGTGQITVAGFTLPNAGAWLIGGAALNSSNAANAATVPASWTPQWDLGGKRSVYAHRGPELSGSTGSFVWNFGGSFTTAREAWVTALEPADAGGGQAPTPVLSSRLVGPGGTPTTARVNARVASASTVRLKLGTDTAVTTGVVWGDPVTPDAQGNALLTASGLTAGTVYYYRVAMTDTGTPAVEYLDTAATVGRLKTAPTGAASFAFLFSSCDNDGASDAWPAMAARGDDLFFHLGDAYYFDGQSTAVSNFRDKQLLRITESGHQALYATTPSIYTPSDHDGMYNNGNAGNNATAWANWNSVYRELWPTPTLPGGSNGCYYAFSWGRVRFIVWDTRSFATTPGATDDAAKSCLGATQKQWVKDQVTNATEPVIVIANDNPWPGAAEAGGDGWFGYTTERAELAAHFAASGKKIVMLGGDMHALAAENGSTSPGGVVVLQASPLFNAASHKGGPYDVGPYPASGTAGVRQYGRVVVTDTGSQITLVYSGYDSGGTERVTLTDVTATPVTGTPRTPLLLLLREQEVGSAAGAVTGGWQFGPAAVTGDRTSTATAAGGWEVGPGTVTGSTTAAGAAAGGWEFGPGAVAGSSAAAGAVVGGWTFGPATAAGSTTSSATVTGGWTWGAGLVVGTAPAVDGASGVVVGGWTFGVGQVDGSTTHSATVTGGWAFGAATVTSSRPSAATAAGGWTWGAGLVVGGTSSTATAVGGWQFGPGVAVGANAAPPPPPPGRTFTTPARPRTFTGTARTRTFTTTARARTFERF